MPGDDLKTYAQSTQDYYGLLEIEESAGEAEIRRAYRRTALKYHPDKHGGSTEAVDKFHQLQIAYDVLSDAEAKAIYDQGRRARQEREARTRALGDRKRKMVEELEKREGAWKRTRQEEEDEERDERRRAEEGARRRHELTEKWRKEAEAQEQESQHDTGHATGDATTQPSIILAAVADMDKVVKIRWQRLASQTVEKSSLETFFKRYGAVEGVVIMKDKKKRKDMEDEKAVLGSAAIAFESVSAAFAAVEDASKHWTDTFGNTFDRIAWSSGEEPVSISQLRSAPLANYTNADDPGYLTSSEIARIRMRIAVKRNQEIKAAREQEAREAAAAAAAATTSAAPAQDDLGKPTESIPDRPAVRKIPSFASFKRTPQRAPPKSSLSSSPYINSPALADMQRKRAEREALEAEIRAQDAAEDAAQ